MKTRKTCRARSAHTYIDLRQGTQGFQAQLIRGGYPQRWDKAGKAYGTGIPKRVGKYRHRKPRIPALFRRSTQSRSIRWDRTFGERRTKWALQY